MYHITTGKAPVATGPYSQGASAARFVFVSGQIAADPASGELVSGNITDQTHRAIENVDAVLTEAGLTMFDVSQVTVYLAHMEDYDAMNAAYAMHFSVPWPARTCVEVASLPQGALVEIDCVAVR